MLNIPAGWKPIESAPKDGTEILAWRSDCGQFIASYTSADSFPMTQDELDAWDEETLFAKDWFTQWPQAYRLEGIEVPTHWMPLPAAPAAAPSPSAPGDAQDEDDSIALDKLADYIADTWPDKKYGLEEICQRLHAMWPGEFLSAADLEKNDPNVREALRALLLWWDRFQASDGDPKDACELLVKDARSAWQFAEAEINRAPATAPAAGDARAITLPAKMPKHEGNGSEYPSSESYHEGYAEGWNDAIDAALAAQVPHKGDAA